MPVFLPFGDRVRGLFTRETGGLSFQVALGVSISTSIRRIRSGCCARVAKGHATIAPPIAAINFRRLIVTGMCPSRARA
jgi:hypothetical protein